MSGSSLLKVRSVLLMGVGLMLISQTLFAAQVTLTWDAVTDSSLQGYEIYYGTASKNYATTVNAGNVTSYTITGLGDNTTYYFAVTAYGSSGESGLSDEVTYTTPLSNSKSKSCTYSLSSRGASYGWSGGAGSVTVSAPAGCAWNSSTPPSWLNLTSGANGAGNGSVIYSVGPNNNVNSRTVGFTIAGQAFTVSQTGLPQYTVTASAGTGGSVTPSGSVTVAQGGSQSFAIASNPGHYIAGVQVDGQSAGAVISYTFNNVAASHSISATFGLLSYTLNITRNGTGTGTVTVSPNQSTFPWGTQIILTAAAAYGSEFTGWSGACSGTSPTCTLTMQGNSAVSASFTPKSYKK